MRYVKVFEAWTEEKEEQVSHKDLYEMLEEFVDAWKAWKENEDEEADEEELHDEFMKKVEDLIEKAKSVVEEKEEEKEEEEEEGEKEEEREEEKEEEDEDAGESEEEVESDEVKEVEESRRDLSGDAGSLTNMLEPLVSSMEAMSMEELKDAFMGILNSPELKASQMTRSKWMNLAMRAKNRLELMRTITNIYLRGSALGANPKDY